MRRSPLALLGLVLAAALAASGCAPRAATPDPTTSVETAPTAEPSPTVDPVVVGPAEMPPPVFGGDCTKALSSEDVAAVMGDAWSSEPSRTQPVSANVGALECVWTKSDDSNAQVRVTVIQESALDGAALSAELADEYYAGCEIAVCSWQGGEDGLWIGIDFIERDLTRQVVDSWGADLGELIIARHVQAAPAPWVRDRNGWWPSLDCAQVAEAVSAQLGETLAGQDAGWEEIPAPGYMLAHQASRGTECNLALGDTYLRFSMSSGTGAERPPGFEWTAEDLGVPGIQAFVSDQEDVADYTFTDGINTATIQIHTWPGDPVVPHRDIAVAVAAAAASGFE